MARGNSKSMITFGVKIEDGIDGFKTLTTSVEALQKVLASTVTKADRLDKKFINIAAVASSLNGVKDSFAQVKDILGGLTEESNKFAAAMKATNTMAGKDAAGLGDLKDQVTDLAKSIPLAREELANGLYQVISNGVPENNWIEFLNASSRSAVGGIADLGTAVTVTSTIIKNYGLEWDKAKEIQDKIQLTAKNGVTSFEQLAASLPKVTGNAATLGVGINELMASFATLTGVSGNTSEVATQLAAIFTALVKPSSEAGKMAAQMGIQFDAAAIKAAGGFQNFIKQLKVDVQEFAKSSGMLEQEIYGKFFGSAESLRALVPLTGELAEKFDQNVLSMKDSAGTMDAAFKEMASTGSAKSQLLKNKWTEVTDFIARATSGMLPYLDFSSTILTSATSVYILSRAVQSVNYHAKISTAINNALALSIRVLGLRSKFTTDLMLLLSGAFKGCGQSALALQVALRGLLVASGVGLVIWGLTAAVQAYTAAQGNAEAASKRMAAIEEASKKMSELSTEAANAEAEARKNVVSSLELNIARLKEFKGSKEEEARLVAEMNSTYGQTMGYFSSVASWYKALVANSKEYCRQMIAEAKARKLADQVAELEIARDKIAFNEDGSHKMYSTRRDKRAKTITDAFGNSHVVGEESIAGTSELDKAQAKIDKLSRSIAHLRGETAKSTKEAASIQMAIMGSTKNPSDGTPETTKKQGESKTNKEKPAPVGSIADYEKKVSEIDKKVKLSIDPDEIFKLEKEKADLQKKIKDLEIPIRWVTGKEQLEKKLAEIEPIKLNVDVKMGNLTKELKKIPLGLTAAEKLQQTLGNISGVANQAGEAFRNMGQAFEMPALDIMGMLAGAIATMIQGYATATAQSSAMGPWAWLGFGLTGLAQLGAMISQVKNLSAFADGGIVSGPTLGLVGEYAGARSNPEVIAPLNKLKDIIGEPAGAPVIVGGRIVADGRNLAVVLENYTRVSGKSGHRNKF